MKNSLLLLLISPLYLLAGTNEKDWTASQQNTKRFIENRSQFDRMDNSAGSKILFGVDGGNTRIFFTAQGLTYRFDSSEKNKDRKKGSPEPKYIANYDLVHMQWENANANAEVIAEDAVPDYFSYTMGKGEEARNINFIKGYKKLIYKNLYPHIDAVYEFHPTDGIKYSFILHPGADPSQIKMKYNKTLSVSEGDIHIPTKFGDITDHSPLTFYSGSSSSVITSSFVMMGNTISFSLGNYDKTQTVVIDPWTQTPTLPSSNGVWECERDANGNVYIIGGENPLRLQKYNSAGTLQWTYSTPYDTVGGEWLGTLATDLAGNSYVTNGSSAQMQKISTAGGMTWSVNGGSFDEYWTISFNCDQTKLIVGGTRITLNAMLQLTGYGKIFDINTSNGSVNSSINVGHTLNYTVLGLPVTDPNEVRTMTSSKNARYYYLTLDTLGCIDQNFSACPSGNPIFSINSGYNLGYKCETFRPNNGNGGIKAIRANENFVYTQNGTNIQKRSLVNGAVLATAPIPGGINVAVGMTVPALYQVGNSGIDIDTCGNVYVGSDKAIIKYDANLNQLASAAVAFTVYDVAVSTNGDVIACGAVLDNSNTSRTGHVQSIASFAACKPLTLQCCNANICSAGPYCVTDPAVTLSSSTPGGVWSGTGITNTSTGVFNPSVAGTGTFTITYTLACGSASIQIIVKNCALPVVCLEPNGDLTVSGGGGPTYTWSVWSPGGSTPITNQTECTNCNPSYSWIFGQCMNGLTPVTTCTTAPGYQQFATGTTVTPPGTWPIRVVDGSGNTVILNSLAGIPACSNLNTSQINADCFGQCSGTATVTPTSGTPPFTYAWNTTPVQTTQVATGLCAGTYSVSVTDASPSTSSATVTITQPAALTATASATSSSCGSGGTATVSASGGTINYTYAWSPSGGNSSAATGLSAGNYTATVTDAHGCTSTATVSITTASGGTVSITSQTLLCNGDSSVTSASMSGGTSPFTYAWSGGQTTSSINVPAGNYSVTVTDANGCTSTQSVSISQPTALTSSVSSTGTNCGASTGSAVVTASGGTGSLTYAWSPGGQTTPAISNLAAGTYSCTITDANGCSQTVSTVVTNLNGPTASITGQTNNNCFGGTSGTAAANAAGGTTPYTYLWNTTPAQTSANATGLSAGTYTVIVTDATGCTNTQTVLITQPAAVTASVTNTAASCGNSDGTATATPSGGTSPYTYLWNPSSATGATATGLAAGNYSVTITDANGCAQTFTTTINNSNGPTALAGISATITQGNSAQLSASGGVTYSWSPSTGLNNPNISNPTASPDSTTEYCVFVSDANGCSDSACITIYVEAPCGNHFLPNAFSPNGDNENDVLKLYLTHINCVKEYHLTIYDRWGEELFNSIDPSETWNGMYKGKLMNTQVVAYSLYILFTDGKMVDTKGNVSLMR